ncbi:MAG: hypothetical protein MZV70_24265 [Desulfobacterales bacterium]|nr:hypothetical protein [Desulfobacterales bacterium]
MSWIIRFMANRFYEEPLVGFVRGNDPILEQYKEIIGPHHFTPWEIMRWQAENNGVKPPASEDLSVVSFVMPFSPKTKRDNAAAVDWTIRKMGADAPSG